MKQIEEIQSQFLRDKQQDLSQENLRIKYLGRKGLIAQAFKQLPKLNPSERGAFGAQLNQLKVKLEETLLEKEMSQELSIPNIAPPNLQEVRRTIGHLSPVSSMIYRIQDIFEKLGFSVALGSEIEDEWHNFDSLNIPANHPARDVWDTIWLQDSQGVSSLLRTHTSPGQIRYMKTHNSPIRVLIPGKVYRYEATDATHETAFHQVEGLMLDDTTSIATFKGIIEYVFDEIFPGKTKIRLRPSYFPFTEPSFEIDIWFGGRWLEIAGAGMVHRKVLEAGGIIDPNIQGFAFGMGVERLVMILTGLTDIRHIHGADLRFSYQMGTRHDN